MNERRVERLIERVSADVKTLEDMKGMVTEAIARARAAVARSRRLKRRIAARRDAASIADLEDHEPDFIRPRPLDIARLPIGRDEKTWTGHRGNGRCPSTTGRLTGGA